MKRENILHNIIGEQQKVIDNLQQSVNRYKTASDLDEDDTSDPDDLSRQTEAKDMQLRYEKMSTEALQNLNFLLAEKTKSHTEIEAGSLIETDKNYIFIGISLPVFNVENKPLISISEDAPVFENIKTKQIGDQLKIADQNGIVKSIS